MEADKVSSSDYSAMDTRFCLSIVSCHWLHRFPLNPFTLDHKLPPTMPAIKQNRNFEIFAIVKFTMEDPLNYWSIPSDMLYISLQYHSSLLYISLQYHSSLYAGTYVAGEHGQVSAVQPEQQRLPHPSSNTTWLLKFNRSIDRTLSVPRFHCL